MWVIVINPAKIPPINGVVSEIGSTATCTAKSPFVSSPSRESQLAGRGMLLNILFASQSGTAEEYAERIAYEAYVHGHQYTFNALDEAIPERAPEIIEAYWIIVCSTTGDGEFPSNGRRFWNSLLNPALPHDYLSHLRVAILGLGDSAYEKFNFAAKKLHRRMEQLGARMILERADADEQHPLGQDAIYIPWNDLLWSLFNASTNPSSGAIKGLDNIWEPKVSIIPVSSQQTLGIAPEATLCLDISGKRRLDSSGTVKENKEITSSDHFQDVRHIEIELDEPFEYFPGDVAILLANNPEDLVQDTIAAFGWKQHVVAMSDSPADGKQLFEIKPNRVEAGQCPLFKEHSSPIIVSLECLLMHYLDIRCPPRRSFFRILHNCLLVATESADTFAPEIDLDLYGDKLRELFSPEGLDLYLSYVWKPKRMPHEIMADFPILQDCIPIQWIFDLFPPLRPREYSISSYDPRHQMISITAALVEYRTLTSLPLREGLCSNWLRRLQIDQRISLSIKHGSWFRVIKGRPIEVANDMGLTPMIMIAAGTGIAPMRSIIQYASKVTPTREVYLFFGCRYSDRDNLYSEEGYLHPMLHRFVLGSREGAPGAGRQYLPKLLKTHARLLVDLIEGDAIIFVAGNAKFPKIVKEAINEICQEPDMSNVLIALDRLHIECWS